MRKIKSVHTEYYNNNTYSISVLLEYDNNKKINSYILYYNNGIYTVFNTIYDCFKYDMYEDNNINRGYISEEDFDELYDNGFEDNFISYVEWV